MKIMNFYILAFAFLVLSITFVFSSQAGYQKKIKSKSKSAKRCHRKMKDRRECNPPCERGEKCTRRGKCEKLPWGN